MGSLAVVRWLLVGFLFFGAGLAYAQTENSSTEESAPADDASSSAESEEPEVQSERSTSDAAEEPLDGVEILSGAASFFESLELGRLATETPGWGWVTFFCCVAGGIAGGILIGLVLRILAARFGKWTGKEALATFLRDLAAPASMLVIVIGAAFGLSVLPLSETLKSITGMLIAFAILFAIFWAALNLVDVIEVYLKRRVKATEGKLDDQALPLIRRSLRILVFLIGALTIADNVFGANIGAALAGLGIAGIAVSLAAQDSLKNLFGSLTILFDDPFQIGERIVFQGHDGTIEKVGFRSTKLRTLTGHLVTIPNSAIVNESVENIGRRPTIRRLMNLGVTYDTPPEKLQEGVEIIRELLNSDELKEPVHPTVDGNTLDPVVYFTDFNADNLGILVVYWYGPPDYMAYLEHGHRFNLALLERFEQAGIEFAFPTETLMLAGDSKRDLTVKMLADNLEQAGGKSNG